MINIYTEIEDEMILIMNYDVDYFLGHFEINDISDKLIDEYIQAFIILGE